MKTVDQERATRASGAGRPLFEALAAGLCLGGLDALAGGLQRMPLELLWLSLALGLALGLGAALIAVPTRRPGAALALVLVAGSVLNVASIASKELGLVTLRVTLPLACLALAPPLFVRRRARGAAAGALLLASVPIASLTVGLLGASFSTVLLAALLPVATGLLLFTGPLRRSSAARTGAAALALVLVVTPVLWRDPDRERPDLPPPTEMARADAPDVLFLLVDTLRADAVADEGEGLFARIGREGVRFERCVSTAPWTLPSVSSILTSLLPSQHGATSSGHALPLEVETLAESFRAAGYRTAAVTGGAFVSPAFRLDQGFEHFDETAELGFRPFLLHVPLAWRVAKNRYFPLRAAVRWVDEYPGARGLVDAALAWLERLEDDRPLFMLVHSYEAHDYYLYHPHVDDAFLDELPSPSERFAGRLSVHPSELEGASQEDLDWFETIYRRRIEHVESELDRLHGALAAERGRDLVTVLVSDHGEGWDARRGRVHHGGRLHDDLLLVPFVLHAPDRLPAGRHGEPVSTLDVMPTLLELAGVALPQDLTGTSLAPFLRAGEPTPARRQWSEERTNGVDLVALRAQGWKLLRSEDRAPVGFDLDRDPLEDEPLAGPPEELEEALRGFEELFPPREVDPNELDEATRQNLERLGYLGGEDEDD